MERNYLNELEAENAPKSGIKSPQKVSKPGEYRGYSEILYPETVRNSQYIPGYEGTKLAIDIYRPAKNGQADNRRGLR